MTLGVLLTIRDLFEPWVWMWLVAFAIFFGFKLLTLLRLDEQSSKKFTPRILAAYLFLWPGLRPSMFIGPIPENGQRFGYLWANGCFQMVVGGIAIWVMPRWLSPNSSLWLRAWIGMAGFSLLVHFGFFDLLTTLWRTRGVPAEKLFSNAWRSVSLADFWSNRWNRAFSEFARDLLFRPLSRLWGTRWASFLVFAFSGLVHEIMISVPARGGYGGPMIYFLTNGLGVWIEGLSGWRKLTRRWPVVGRIWAMAAVIAPLPLLFHEAFRTQIVLPFLNALGGGSEPINC